MAISKHLVSERGAAYQLLKNGVGMTSLQLQKDILEAGSGPAASGQQGPSNLLRLVQQRSQEMDAVNASTALHLLASMSIQHTGEVKSASQTLLRRVLEEQDAEPRALAISSWSAARLRLQEPAPLLALGEAIIAAESEFEGQDVANVTWGFANLKAPNYDEVLRCMAGRSLRHLRSFEPRHLSNICWALATGRVTHALLFEAAARAVAERAKSSVEVSAANAFGSQDISNMLWAYATTKCIAVSPLPPLADRAAKLGWDQFQPQEVSICMWAAMTLGVADARPQVHAAVQRLLQHTARQIRKGGTSSFEPRHLSNAAWALARWQRHCRLTGLRQECKAAVARPALRSIAQEASGRLDDFAEHELVRLLWALGSEGCLHLRLLAKPLTTTLSKPSSSSSDSLPFPSNRLVKLDVEQLTTLATVLSWTLERAVWEPRAAQGRNALPAVPGDDRSGFRETTRDAAIEKQSRGQQPHSDEESPNFVGQQVSQALDKPTPPPPPPPPPSPPPLPSSAPLEGRLRDDDTRRRRRRNG